MKFRHYEFLCLLVTGCVGAVVLTSQLNAMYLAAPVKFLAQEPRVQTEAAESIVGEELPSRTAPIVYGNQAPFSLMPDANTNNTANSFSPPVGAQESPSSTADTQPQSVLRPSYDPGAIDPQFEPGQIGQGVEDEISYLTDEDDLERRSQEIQSSDGLPQPMQPTSPRMSAPFFEISPSQITQPRSQFSIPMESAPVISSQAAELPLLPPASGIIDGIPADQAPIPMPPGSITNPGVLHGPGCNCGAVTCVRCCQPRCITKTIYVPEWYTVWSSIFETRYKTQIREQAYTVTEEVDHQVPVVQPFTVMVPEPRLRTYQTYRQEEYQVAIEEPYTVMVPVPQQRQETVEREEAFKVPVEEQYTVMVPQEKEVFETKYKVVKDKEAVEKKFSVQVPKDKTRLIMAYETGIVSRKVREPYVEKVREARTKKVVKYRLEPRTREVSEVVVEYNKVRKERPVTKYRVVTRYRPVEETYIDYFESDEEQTEDSTVQIPVEKTIKQPYKVSVPFIEKKFERYFENEPYEEKVTLSYQGREQVPREITRPYYVKIPYLEYAPREYKVKVPYEKMVKGIRTIPKQIPETKYQTGKRDVGHWVTETCVVPTYEITDDICGCSTCCPKNRTVRKTVWKPNIVTEKIPYTTYKTVKEKVEYEYPVKAEREEVRTRMLPVTKYKTEQRKSTFTVFEFKPVTKTNTFTIRKFRQVPKTREIEVQKFREEERVRDMKVTEYRNKQEPKKIPYTVRVPKTQTRTVMEPYSDRESYTETEYYDILEPVEKTVTRTETYTIKVPYDDDETYYVEVPEIRYKETEKELKIQFPKPRFETYTVMVPEIRTKIEYVDVERRVPYVETKMVKVMVPEIRTRRVYKTDTKVVSEIKTQTYMTMVPETKTRTVYKKKYRDVPINRAEIEWENIPKVLKKTVFKTVKKKVRRPRMRRIPVKVPYQVQIRIPHRACRMVPRTITIPVEECCERCTYHIMGMNELAPQYIDYGVHQIGHAWRWLRDPMEIFW